MKNDGKNTIVGLKELRENIDRYITKVNAGGSFLVVRKSKPVFRITPVQEEDNGPWEAVVDFTKFKKGGIHIKDLLARL